MLWHSTTPQCGEDMEVAATHGSIQSPGKVINNKYLKVHLLWHKKQSFFFATQPYILYSKMTRVSVQEFKK